MNFEAARRLVPAVVVLILGLVLTVSLVAHVLARSSQSVAVLGLDLLLVGFALAITVSGGWLLRSVVPAESAWWFLGWVVGSIAATVLFGVALLVHLDASTTIRANPTFFVTGATTSGGAVGLVVGWVDHRSRRRGRRLAESERQQRSIFENTLDALLLADDDGRYIDANVAATELLGIDRETLLGTQIEAYAAPDFDVEGAWAEFRAGSGDRGLFPLQRPDGEIRLVEFAATRDVYPGTHLSALRDVTERERSQQLLAEQHGQLVFLNRMLRHHVRNNLQVVVAEADKLDDTNDASAAVLLARIDAIESLLDDVGRFTSSLTRDEPLYAVDLDDILSSAVESVETAEPRVDVAIGDRTGVTAVADGLLIDVFENLLSNAVQHNDLDRPRVRISTTADEETVTVTVCDDGPGIDPDRTQRIFEWTDGPAADMGFGLYLSKALVNRYGGRIWVEQCPDLGGAAFSVQLRRDLHEALSLRWKSGTGAL